MKLSYIEIYLEKLTTYNNRPNELQRTVVNPSQARRSMLTASRPPEASGVLMFKPYSLNSYFA